ncbi:MAG: signal peptidase I, partial [Clostridia bacterium]|nr:signal peptidase I [Clostridia bacterium]
PEPEEAPAAEAEPEAEEPEPEQESEPEREPEPNQAEYDYDPAYAAAATLAAPAQDKKEKKRRDPVTGVFEWVESAIFAVVVVILLFTFVFRIVGIDGRSMVPTLQDDDRVVISNLFYTPKTGDIVVLDTSEDTIFFNGRQYSKPLIKRVIATGGQTVEVRNTEDGVQEVYVDGVKLEEDYINFQTVSRSSVQEKITVPKGYIFVMGDNRGESLDSRSFGCISENAIVGRALFRIFPLSEMGLLTNS